MTNSINIGIIGCVSAGKSTLLNSIFGKCLSDMKIKRTTMVPQIYHLKHNDVCNANIDEIINTNKTTNQSFTNKVWNGIDVCNYNIKHPTNFIELSDEFEFNIYDIPGINDQQTKDIYMNWLKVNLCKFHFVIYVIDVYSSLNTSDEIEILDVITEHILHSSHLICLINKCDNQVFNETDNSFRHDDEELEDIIETQIKPTIQKKISNKKFKSYIQSFSSKKCFLYRCIECNDTDELILSNLDSKHLESLMIEAVGKSKWSRFNDETKIEYAKKKVIEIKDDNEDITNILLDSGYTNLIHYINNIITNDSEFFINYWKNIIEFSHIFKNTFIQGSLFLNICKSLIQVKDIKPFFNNTDTNILIEFEKEIIRFIFSRKYVNNFVSKYNIITIEEFDIVIIEEFNLYYQAMNLIKDNNLLCNQNTYICSKIDEYISNIISTNTFKDIEFVKKFIVHPIITKTHAELLISKLSFDKDTSINLFQYISFIKLLFNKQYIDEEKVFEMLYNKMDNVLDYIMKGLSNEKIFDNNELDLGTNQYNNYAGIFILTKQLENKKDNKYVMPIYHALTDMLDIMKSQYNIIINIENYKKIFDFINDNPGNIFDDLFNITYKSNNISLEIEVIDDNNVENNFENNNDNSNVSKSVTSSITGWFTRKVFNWN